MPTAEPLSVGVLLEARSDDLALVFLLFAFREVLEVLDRLGDGDGVLVELVLNSGRVGLDPGAVGIGRVDVSFRVGLGGRDGVLSLLDLAEHLARQIGQVGATTAHANLQGAGDLLEALLVVSDEFLEPAQFAVVRLGAVAVGLVDDLGGVGRLRIDALRLVAEARDGEDGAAQRLRRVADERCQCLDGAGHVVVGDGVLGGLVRDGRQVLDDGHQGLLHVLLELLVVVLDVLGEVCVDHWILVSVGKTPRRRWLDGSLKLFNYRPAGVFPVTGVSWIARTTYKRLIT